MDSLFESKLQQFKKTIDDIRGEMESIQNHQDTFNKNNNRSERVNPSLNFDSQYNFSYDNFNNYEHLISPQSTQRSKLNEKQDNFESKVENNNDTKYDGSIINKYQKTNHNKNKTSPNKTSPNNKHYDIHEHYKSREQFNKQDSIFDLKNHIKDLYEIIDELDKKNKEYIDTIKELETRVSSEFIKIKCMKTYNSSPDFKKFVDKKCESNESKIETNTNDLNQLIEEIKIRLGEYTQQKQKQPLKSNEEIIPKIVKQNSLIKSFKIKDKLVNNISKLYSDIFGINYKDQNSSDYIKELWSWIKSLFQLNKKDKESINVNNNTNNNNNVNNNVNNEKYKVYKDFCENIMKSTNIKNFEEMAGLVKSLLSKKDNRDKDKVINDIVIKDNNQLPRKSQ